MHHHPARIPAAARAALLPGAMLCMLLANRAEAQVAAGAVGPGEFPGLQILPPGSVLKGISIPRYEKNRVTTLMTFGRMEVQTRSIILFSTLRTQLYSKEGETTEIVTEKGDYDFSTDLVKTDAAVSIGSPRLEIKGGGIVFNTKKHLGLLRGPVSSAIRSDGYKPSAETAAPAAK